jgi:hypothetical protein
MRSESYRPLVLCTGYHMHCQYEDVGGSCWGCVELVDEVDTNSQHVDYYACKGHVEVAWYGYSDRYREEKL